VGAFFNDPEYTARIDRDALANPSPGPTLGAWEQAGLGVMRGGAMAADAVRMAAAAPVVAFGDDETQDAYFAATDEVIKSAVDRWTPDPATTTLAGRVMGGLAEAALPLMAAGGNPALLMASNQTRTSRSLVDQGVDASTARDVGMVDALAIGAGFMIPAVGRTLASKLAFGAVSNPLLNAAGITVQAGALNEAGAPQAAAQYDPWDLESRAVDAALGAAFGGMAHAMGAPGGAPPMGRGFDDAGRVFRESVDEILTYRGAQRYESRALGAPTIAARNAHDRAMRTAMEQAIRGEPVAVGAADMPAPPDTPTIDAQAIGAEIARDVFAPLRAQVDPVARLDGAMANGNGAERRAALLDYLDRFVAEKRRTAPVGMFEGYFSGKDMDTDRGAARYVEKYRDALPPSVEKALHFENVRDLETGESLNALIDGVRGGHIGQLRRTVEDAAAEQGGRASGGAGAGGEPGQGAPAGAGRGVEVLARDGGDLPSRLRITDGGKATTIDVLARDGEGRIAQFATDEAATPKGAAAGEDIDLDLLPEARDLAMAEPDAPIMMVDDLTETTAAQALADADAAIVEAETTYQRAAHAAAGCLLG